MGNKSRRKHDKEQETYGSRAIQEHHISYNPEKIVRLFKGEHHIITLMNRYNRNTVSKGFIKCLRIYIEDNKRKAVRL